MSSDALGVSIIALPATAFFLFLIRNSLRKPAWLPILIGAIVGTTGSLFLALAGTVMSAAPSGDDEVVLQSVLIGCVGGAVLGFAAMRLMKKQES